MSLRHYTQLERDGDRFAAEGDLAKAQAAYDDAAALRPSATWTTRKLTTLQPYEKPGVDTSRLNLFMPYYTPADQDRADELRRCLDQNIDSFLFSRIILLVDDDTIPHRKHKWLQVIRLNRRPTYLDWIEKARQICPGEIAILANSDIYFDDSITKIGRIFRKDPKAFIALSRFDKSGDDLLPHPNPHWSQDTWAFLPGSEAQPRLEQRSNIPLGVPRCDNRIAYVFGTDGYSVYNPFPFVRSIHLHETGRRYYSKTGDRSIIGGVAMVHPGETLETEAKLAIELWAEKSTQITSIKVNPTLERWAEKERKLAEPRPALLAHDADWQYPAITEQHAFERMRALLPAEKGRYEAVYLAFPFATLIDLHAQLGPNHARTRALQAALDALVRETEVYERVVTVCQHIRGRQFAHIFRNAKITDLFWSHKTTDESFNEAPGMRLHPFPLYPVQQLLRGAEDIARPRRWLFSFVGARAQKNYLSEVRTHIIELLSDHQYGKVIDRDNWHYQKVVYDAQVFQKAAAGDVLVDEADSDLFREVMDETTFTLCPSGSGPNSIRLWEAMVNGSIPVILADTWAAPGDPALWEAATVRCAETAADVASLPAHLMEIAANPDRLSAMRHALLALAGLYGPEGFVGDVADMFETSRPMG